MLYLIFQSVSANIITIGGGKIVFLAILPPQIPFKCQQWWRKRQIILPFCYSELPRLAIHCSKVV